MIYIKIGINGSRTTFKPIGVMTIDESGWLSMVLRCGGGRVFKVKVEGACRHFSTSTLKSKSERGGYMRNMVKVNRTSRMMRNHPYIGAKEHNWLHEMWRELGSPLKMIWMVKMELGHVSMWWSVSSLACSLAMLLLTPLGVALWVLRNFAGF